MLAAPLAVAGALRADAVADFVAAEMRQQRIPGLALAIQRRGAPLRAEGHGLANVELEAPVTPATVFQTGSIGKQFTAAAVLLLVEDGKLALDDPLSRYFPEASDHWRGITVRQLLTHTAGVPDYGPPEVDFRAEYTEEQLLGILMRPPPAFAPGSRWSYSNAGYVVLGGLIRKLTGAHWSELVARRIFTPAGMSSARLIDEAAIVPGRAAGYRIDRGALANQEWVSPALNSTADGSLYASVLDLARWDAALDGDGLLSAQSKRGMWEPVELAGGRRSPYGFGWAVSDQRGRALLEHSGHWQGFSAHIARYPEPRVTVVVMCNLAFAQVRRIAHGIAARVAPELALPDPRETAPDPVAGRERRFRETLQAWVDGRPLPHTVAGVAPTPPPPGEEIGRRRLGERLQHAVGFGWLASDDVRSRNLTRNGSAIVEIVHYGLRTPDEGYRYHFYLDDAGRVADFVPEEW